MIETPLINTFSDSAQWVLWKLEDRDGNGKKTKVPYTATHSHASSTRPETWDTFANVRDVYQRFKGSYNGIGIVFTPDKTLLGIDLDKVLDGPTIADTAAAQLVEAAATYCEISPSGTGLHLYLQVDTPLDLEANRHDGYECYTSGRYFTVTAKPYGDPRPIRTVSPDEAIKLLSILGYPWENQTKPTPLATPKAAPLSATTDEDVITIIRRSAQAAKFESLFDRGELNAYESGSEADLALCSMLAFYTQDPEQIRAIVSRSALGQRDKWRDRADYQERTIRKALKDQTATYDPNYRRSPTPAPSRPAVIVPPAPATPTEPPSAKPVNLADYEPDDSGNADAFLAVNPSGYLYTASHGWMTFTGTHWTRDNAEQRLENTIAEVLRQRQHAAIDSKRTAVVTAATPNAKRIRDCKFILQSRLVADVGTFDTHDHLLNVRNGVIDLRTGRVSPHDHTLRMTHLVDCEYNPTANAGLFRNFLTGVIDGGDTTANWLQTILGYCLTGDTRFEIVLYLHGKTRAGKGTTIEALSALLGDLARPLSFTSLIEKRDPDASNFDLAPLRNARLVIADESDRRDRLNGGKFKALTGGNALSCCYKHRDFFSYRPKFKILLVSNWPPNADADDDAIWSRLRVVEFPNSHAGSEDFTLKSRLKSEPYQQSLLAWLVQGAIQFYQSGSIGIAAPEVVTKATQARRDDLDEVKQWIDTVCITGDYFTENHRVYQSYAKWCVDNGYTAKLQRSLTSSLNAKGYLSIVKKVEGASKRGISGILAQ